MSDDIEYPRFKQYVWVGPQIMSDNGLELRSIVTEERGGTFHAGTRYGPIGGTLPEHGPEEYFVTRDFRNKEEAMFAAKRDTNEVLRRCNDVHKERKAEELIRKATTPSKETKRLTRPNIRLIER